MLYINITRQDGKIISASVSKEPSREAETRNDWKSFEEAQAVADALGKDYIATDAGSHVSPRYDVQALPKVGEAVSYAFNGDCYPCGTIKSVSAGPLFRRIVAVDEHGAQSIFFRRRLSGSWIKDQTWSLVRGTIYEQNPSF